jgi:hypothetical protein
MAGRISPAGRFDATDSARSLPTLLTCIDNNVKMAVWEFDETFWNGTQLRRAGERETKRAVIRQREIEADRLAQAAEGVLI